MADSIGPSGAQTTHGLAWLGPAVALGAPIALTVIAATGYLLLLPGGPAWLPWLALAPATLLGFREMRGDGTPGGRAVLLVIAAGLAWAFGVFGAGEVLPAGDAIAAPQFARAIAEGRTLLEAFPAGSSGHAYPPGYPLLLAPLTGLGPSGALIGFKLLTVLVVGLIPAAWGWMHWTLFARHAPLWAILGAAYVTFVLVERHLGFLTAFAGKNAVQFALLLFPAVIVSTIRSGARPWTWPLAAPPLLGLFLIHYSMAYLAAAFLAAHVLVSGDWRRLSAGRMAAAGVIAVGLAVAVLGPALHDPRVAMDAWDPGRALLELGRQFAALKPNLVVFHDGPFGLAPAPFRLLSVTACAAFAVVVGRRCAEPGLWRGAAVYGLALLISLVVGYGVLPLGLSVDFMRCYAWTLQAGLFLTAGLAAWRLWRRVRFRGRTAAVAAIALAALVIAVRDIQVERRIFTRRVVDAAEVAEIAGALPSRARCFLIAASTARPEVLVTEQDIVAWNYAEAVSPCVFLTGSWVQPGPPEGRALDGLPSGSVLGGLPSGAAVFFVGDAPRLRAYDADLRRQGHTWTWRLVDPEAGGGAVWQGATPRQP